MSTKLRDKEIKSWSGQAFNDQCTVSYKVDGVRLLRDGDSWFTRGGNEVNKLRGRFLDLEDVELYSGSWSGSISLLHNTEEITRDNMYNLQELDRRLFCTNLECGANSDDIKSLLADALADGWEGLVIRSECGLFKVKPRETYDVLVTKIELGYGGDQGLAKCLHTDMGKVSSGMSINHRKFFCEHIGERHVIEVACQSLTDNNKFRHPVFIRLREDK